MTAMEIEKMFEGLSKREAMALAKEYGYTVVSYWESRHKIPQCIQLNTHEPCMNILALFFDKHTRRIHIY